LFLNGTIDKSAKEVTVATILLLKPYTVLTIKADNGKEFAYHEEMTQALGAPSILLIRTVLGNVGWMKIQMDCYGSRQYWPKCTDFKTVSLREVISVVTSLNDRLTKKLNYKAPAEKMAEHVAALAV
jgi:IS30 family transposase